jgi:hypothetical protein
LVPKILFYARLIVCLGQKDGGLSKMWQQASSAKAA